LKRLQCQALFVEIKRAEATGHFRTEGLHPISQAIEVANVLPSLAQSG